MNQHESFSAGQRIETLRQLFRTRRGHADAADAGPATDALRGALQQAGADPAWQETEWPDTQWSDTNIEPPLLEF